MPRAQDTAAVTEESAEAVTGGRRERRRREVRDRLYDAAVALFLEQGYEATTMDDIGNRADVARTTVFNHFPRKTAFLGEWAARRRNHIAEQLHEGHLDDEPIHVIIESYFELLAELNLHTREEAKVLMTAALAHDNMLDRPPLADTLAAYIRRAQKRGQVRPDADPERTGVMLSATYFAMLIGWCAEDPPRYDLAEALSGAARVVLHGIETA